MNYNYNRRNYSSYNRRNIVPSTSPWSFPLVPVQKHDGTIRVCVDYRKLNQVTKADPHYMSMLAEIVDRIGASGVISKLDITKGYYQVRIKEEDQPKTAFCSPYGKFQFTCVPFGLKNAPALFQKLMERVLFVQRIC